MADLVGIAKERELRENAVRDRLVARIAGNVAAGLVGRFDAWNENAAMDAALMSLDVAEAIVRTLERRRAK